jgi:small subunit ribosomal protein S13
VRIEGVDLPNKERIEIGLTRIFGIGRTVSKKILREANIDPNKNVKTITDDEAVKIRAIIDRDYKVEGDLKREVNSNIKRVIDIGSYRGYRHRIGLPVRGQKTKTNARTRKGPKKSISMKKKAT